jgi:putative acetyltransferase
MHAARDADGRLVAFLGVDGESLEALFVDATSRGAGVGRGLIRYAIDVLGARSVDVNEQNAQAVGFYRHFGFEPIGRSEVDGLGKPYPLLHMRLRSRDDERSRTGSSSRPE